MPLLANNRFFQNAFDGYILHGRGQCLAGIDYDGGVPATTFKPLQGGNIVVLDDPAFDPVTGRPTGNGFPDPCDTSFFSVLSTIGIDGSILECRDVNLSANSELRFIWAFLPLESHTSICFNSFALFVAYDQDDPGSAGDFANATPTYTTVLGQSKNIPDSSRQNICWQVSCWQPQQNFSGTLYWIVSTGAFAQTNSHCRPSMLLLDSVEVNSRV